METRSEDRPGLPLAELEKAEALWQENKRRRTALKATLADDELCRQLGLAPDMVPRSAEAFQPHAWTVLERWTFGMASVAAAALGATLALGTETPDALLIVMSAAGITGLALFLIGCLVGGQGGAK